MSTLTITEQLINLNDEWLFYISPRFLTYTPQIKFTIQTEKYTLTMADSLSELLELFKLRHEIFLADGLNSEGIDVDQYDSECDHIIIKCNKTNSICGTYRVITKKSAVGFYSSSEFNLDEFLKLDGIKMELGRACILPSHRNGYVIDLLWRGIGEYAREIKADYLFGCSSATTISQSKTLSLLKFMERKGMLSQDLNISALDKYKYDLSNISFCEIFSDDELKKHIPSLLNSYINAGALVYGEPAYDREFDCLDFLTILDLNKLSSSYKKRYFKHAIESNIESVI